MYRRCLAPFLLLFSVSSLAAQSSDNTVTLKVHPAGEPSPALKYQLLPDVPDVSPGNAALFYYRAFSPEWYGWRNQPKIYEKMEAVMQAPLSSLSQTGWTWLADSGQLRELDLAARHEYCDWNLTARLRAEGVRMLLPDMQSFRELSRMLAIRTRLAIAAHQYDKAIYSVQTGLALARNIAEAPLLICVLVGVSCADQQLTQLESMMQSPSAPNLYWALTDLPRPFFELRKAYGGEKLLVFSEMPLLKDIEKVHLGPEQIQALAGQCERMLALNDSNSGAPPGKMELVALTLRAYPAAKQSLIAQGWKPDQVEALPALQVVFIHALREALKMRDDSFKWTSLPYPQALAGMRRAEAELNARRHVLALNPLIGLIQPAVRAFQAPWRVERRIAALRTIEAIRLYASANDGRLPATLADIRMVPVPDDPLTGKAFGYQVQGDHFTLTGALPPGDEAPYMAMTYDVTLTQK